MNITKKQIEEGYDAIARRYQGRNKRFGMSDSYHKRIIGMHSHYFGKILDIGSGDGNLLRLLSKKVPMEHTELHGVDISEELCKIAREVAPQAIIVRGDAENLPYESNTFDVVFMTAVLEHMLDYDASLLEVKRVLKPGGLFIASVPNRDWLRYHFYEEIRRKYQPVDDHFFRYSEIRRLLSNHFEVEKYKGSDCLYYYGWKHYLEQGLAFFVPFLYRKMKQHIFKCVNAKGWVNSAHTKTT